jgi:hypothetical protein
VYVLVRNTSIILADPIFPSPPLYPWIFIVDFRVPFIHFPVLETVLTDSISQANAFSLIPLRLHLKTGRP